jgi:hypothetical protein
MITLKSKQCILLIILIFIFTISISSNIESKEKHKNNIIATSNIDFTIIDIGMLHTYVSNSTIYDIRNSDKKTFTIGTTQDQFPCMSWIEAGYILNDYLYFGQFRIGYNSNTLRFSSQTSEDFTVIRNDPTLVSPFEISFSMTDELADSALKVGVKCICKIHAWPEPPRDDYIIYEYLIINNSGKILDDIYCALYLDFDISQAEGGDDGLTYARDDNHNYLVGMDNNGNPESISYMYDGDHPDWRPEDDTGGRLIPKESAGYIGSRVLESPLTKKGVSFNTQSGHINAGISAHPVTGEDFFVLMEREEFREGGGPGDTQDWRVFQSLGPWDLANSDTLHVSFAIGVGEGLEGMRENLQDAYDFYWSNFQDVWAPIITDVSPNLDTMVTYANNSIQFSVEAFDRDNLPLNYTWLLNDSIATETNSSFLLNCSEVPLGINKIVAEVANSSYSSQIVWVIDIKSPLKYRLGQNFPNPFNNMTFIPFEIEENNKVSIDIYDVQGRHIYTVINEEFNLGKHTVHWSGMDKNNNQVSSGLYFYTLRSGNFVETKKLLLLK